MANFINLAKAGFYDGLKFHRIISGFMIQGGDPEGTDNILRVAMFFHDIGKPSCFTIEENNVGHFYGHSEISAQIAEKILTRMKFSNADNRAITELIKYHDTQIGLTSKSVKKLLCKLGEIQFRRLLKVKRADIMAQNPTFAEKRFKALDTIEQILNEIITANSCTSLRDLAINGDDLIQLGIPEGKQIGIVLNRLFEMVINEDVENSRETLLEKIKTI